MGSLLSQERDASGLDFVNGADEHHLSLGDTGGALDGLKYMTNGQSDVRLDGQSQLLFWRDRGVNPVEGGKDVFDQSRDAGSVLHAMEFGGKRSVYRATTPWPSTMKRGAFQWHAGVLQAAGDFRGNDIARDTEY